MFAGWELRDLTEEILQALEKCKILKRIYSCTAGELKDVFFSEQYKRTASNAKRSPSKINFFRAQSTTQEMKAQILSAPPQTSRGLRWESKNPLKHWPGLVLSFCLLISSVCVESNVELRHMSWRGRRWNRSRKKGWAGGWSEWGHRGCSHTFSCSTGAPWEPGIWWTSAPMQHGTVCSPETQLSISHLCWRGSKALKGRSSFWWLEQILIKHWNHLRNGHKYNSCFTNTPWAKC